MYWPNEPNNLLKISLFTEISGFQITNIIVSVRPQNSSNKCVFYLHYLVLIRVRGCLVSGNVSICISNDVIKITYWHYLLFQKSHPWVRICSLKLSRNLSYIWLYRHILTKILWINKKKFTSATFSKRISNHMQDNVSMQKSGMPFELGMPNVPKAHFWQCKLWVNPLLKMTLGHDQPLWLSLVLVPTIIISPSLKYKSELGLCLTVDIDWVTIYRF